ncbi:hydroxyacid dehydrogenase [Prauserella marina]|uniref:Phosphoglycerate dehydrogenase n=1 Tax=Prauserella marina TaxID=530584 RepID=A0A222VPQ7_9PSEU|nr:D-2-hydroxyacid dehydrogenase [Prauserella marina]ASR35909.1 hydroxyacid dehydrogenase [Prauserella marina]PWV84167.1 phosphoglycerate dehydrogenase-like enzyme [Prauserella marina]SDC28924.1 Phosphoglycerate dehydrogenase [Prauserella marina]
MADTPLRIVAAIPFAPEFPKLVESVDPGIELITEPSLLRPNRHVSHDPDSPRFARTGEEQRAYEKMVEQGDILYGIPDQNPELLAKTVRANPDLRWVHTKAAGGGATVRAAGLTETELDRVAFTTSAGVHAGPLAEFAIFGLLAGAKNLRRLQNLQQQRVWAPHWAMGQLRDHTVLILGLGGIGKETARLAHAFGARVLGVKRRPEPVPYVDSVHGVDELGDIAGQVDAVVVTLPGTRYTTNLVDGPLLAAMKPGVVIVNVGRGTVIDEPALIDALRREHVGFACLDVTATEPLPADSPLWNMSRVLISSHTAAEDPAEDSRIAELFAENLGRFLRRDPMRNLVDRKHFY